MWTIIILLAMVALAATLLFRGRPYRAWTWPIAAGLAIWAVAGGPHHFRFWFLGLAFLGLAGLFGIPGLRRSLITVHLMRMIAPILPRISETERLALDAGTVWWDGELFSGRPRWHTLLRFVPERLSRREEDFLEGPVDELCAMVDDWRTVRQGDLSPRVWAFMKEHRFFGMIIPEEYGGLGFSAQAHSAVITRLSSRSVTAAVTVMVPNSLGPAELLMHYGTDAQKRHYLPRLASGEEIPAFALTEPEAGSDAASGRSEGIVCHGVYQGRETLGMRLNWNKRYITLGPVATVLGLAFKLRDPEHLLGDTEELGITCALVPTTTPGVEIGERHDPLGVPFLNGPNLGRDVFVPLDFIIGGPAMAGQGWRMLMDSLAAGRSISLPALSAGAAQVATRVTGAYATVREQFGMPIGRFEGIREPLAAVAGATYLMDAARTLTAAAVDAGEKPAVVSAIMKAYMTELMRRTVNDAMDIQAGAAISEGPRNILANAYHSVPIGITVEGANILTRSLIIYGQGAIRCHPFVQDEIAAVETRDLARFDRAFFGHVGFVFQNLARGKIMGFLGTRFLPPPVSGDLQHHFGRLDRYSAAFVLVSDVAMGTLGAKIKRMERLSGRMADALAWMYLASATLKRFVDQGQRDEHRPVAEYALELAENHVEQALLGVLDNFPNRWVARGLRFALFPWGARQRPPSDELGNAVASLVLDGNPVREELTRAIFVPGAEDPALGRLEAALAKVVAAMPADHKLHTAIREHRLPKVARENLVEEGLRAGIIDDHEARLVREALEARTDAVQVDAFPNEFLIRSEELYGMEEVGS